MSGPTQSGLPDAEATLAFDDAASLADLGRFARRAKAIDDEAALRLQAAGSVLAVWVGVLPGTGILGDGLVLGLRTFSLEVPATIDVAVPAGAVTDRTARSAGVSVLALPPVRLTPTWTSLTPPRSGWEYAGAVSGDDLAEVARSGLQEVSAAVKERGAAAGFTKQQVWGATVTYSPVAGRPEFGKGAGDGIDAGGVELSAGVALAAYALGFLSPGEPVAVYRTNRWTRVTGPGGHVLAR
jgi:hypothetical protein